jgi:hypothetical protein
VALDAQDLAEIEQAAAAITIQGDRYPANIEAMSEH